VVSAIFQRLIDSRGKHVPAVSMHLGDISNAKLLIHDQVQASKKPMNMFRSRFLHEADFMLGGYFSDFLLLLLCLLDFLRFLCFFDFDAESEWLDA